jgi:hypothetical protein
VTETAEYPDRDRDRDDELLPPDPPPVPGYDVPLDDDQVNLEQPYPELQQNPDAQPEQE